MKKILAFFSAIAFFGTSSLAVSACGISKGQKIEMNIANAPKEAKDGQDPLTEYVFNNKYYYNSNNINYILVLAAQLTSDRIYNDNQRTLNGPVWKKFYNSHEWQRGNFLSFNYDQSGTLPDKEQDFSFTGANEKDFIQLKNNDASIDDNKLRIYWFVTSPEAWSSDKPENYKPTKNHIKVPAVTEFTDQKKTILQTGWIHLYLLIGEFRIDFSAQITFTFAKKIDKNSQSLVVLDLDTFNKPFGIINAKDPEKTYNKVISNITISEV
ncbi:MAG: hypothetical protein ACRC8P_00035 [Spiroplasma sp.]